RLQQVSGKDALDAERAGFVAERVVRPQVVIALLVGEELLRPQDSCLSCNITGVVKDDHGFAGSNAAMDEVIDVDDLRDDLGGQTGVNGRRWCRLANGDHRTCLLWLPGSGVGEITSGPCLCRGTVLFDTPEYS